MKLIDEFISRAKEERDSLCMWDEDEYECGLHNGYQFCIELAENIKEVRNNEIQKRDS